MLRDELSEEARFPGLSEHGRQMLSFLREHPSAPVAYPQVHHTTTPLRADARKRGDAGGFNLWAGQAYRLAHAGPAAEIVHTLAGDARAALEQASRRTGRHLRGD